MSGAISGLKEKLFLTRDVKEYSFVSQAEVTIEGVNDAEEMQITDESFDILKFTQTEKDDLWAITAVSSLKMFNGKRLKEDVKINVLF